MRKSQLLILMLVVIVLSLVLSAVGTSHVICDAQLGDSSVKQVVDWRNVRLTGPLGRTSTSLAVLHLPFEGAEPLRIYSSNLGPPLSSLTNSGATYLPNGGHDGFGAYSFDKGSSYGDINYISLPDNFRLSGSFTQSLWVRTNVLNAGRSDLLDFRAAGTVPGPLMALNGAGNAYCYVEGTSGSGSEYRSVTGTTDLTDNNFHHIACVFDSTNSNLILYVDGFLQGSMSGSGTGAITVAINNRGYIGSSRSNSGSPSSSAQNSIYNTAFTGTIDDFQIFNRALSAQQINALYQGRTVLVNEETAVRSSGVEQWQACVTPIRGTITETESCSNDVSITTANDDRDLVISYAVSGDSCPAVRDDFTMSSSAFVNQGSIPLQYACNGVGGSNSIPPLTVENIPASTQSLVIVMEDLTVPTTHWLTWDIPVPAEGEPLDFTATSVRQGLNYEGGIGYAGPCPPVGDTAHTYQFTIYTHNENSLDVADEDNNGVDRAELDNYLEASGNRGTATLTGIFQRPCTDASPCGDGRTCNIDEGICEDQIVPIEMITAVCGNNIIESGEVCDSLNLNSNDCITLGGGFNSGILSCAADCTFDTSQCTSLGEQGDSCGNEGEVNCLDSLSCVLQECKDINQVRSDLLLIIQDSSLSKRQMVARISRTVWNFLR